MAVDTRVLEACYKQVVPLSKLVKVRKIDGLGDQTGVIDKVYLGCLAGIPSVFNALPTTSETATLTHIIRMAIIHALRHHDPPPQSWMRPSNVLCRGYRPDSSSSTGLRQTCDNAQANFFSSLAFQSCLVSTPEQKSEEELHNKRVLYSVLVDASIGVYLHLQNGCFLQLAGLAADELKHLAAKSPKSALPTRNPDGPTPFPASWELPRSSTRIPGTPKTDVSPACFLRYCVSIFHSDGFSRHPGLPRSHILNAFIPQYPALRGEGAAGDTLLEVRSIGDLHALAQRHSHMRRSLAPLHMTNVSSYAGSSLQSSGAAASGSTDSKRSVTAARIQSGPLRVADISDNAARRLMHHIFLHKPHYHDILAYNTRTPTTDKALKSCGKQDSAAPAKFCQETKLPQSLVGLVDTFRELLGRHRSIPYARLLNLFCPPPSWGSGAAHETLSGHKRRRSGATLPVNAQSLGNPLDLACAPECVFRFVRAVLRKMIPASLWGDEPSRRGILSAVYRWITLGRTDVVRCGEVMNGISTSSFPFCGTQHGTAFVQLWLVWLFMGVVSPLIRTHFYVTHSEATGNRSLYYRKPTWAHLTKHGVDMLILKLQLQRYGPGQIASELASTSRHSVGFGTIRLSVKASGVRPIMNLSSPHILAGSTKAFKSVNSVLAVLHDCLTAQYRRNQRTTGSAVFSTQGIHSALVKFVQHAHANLQMADDRLCILACDVKSAFDTIRQQLAKELVVKLLPECHSSYILRRYATVRAISSDPTAKGAIRRRWHRVAYPDGHMPGSFEMCKEASSRSRGLIFIDCVEHTTHQRSQLLRLLTVHLSSHIIQLPNGFFFRQGVGIPQGSVLSTLICNIYLGHMERQQLLPSIGSFIMKAKATGGLTDTVSFKLPSLMMRFTDDFLFISYSKLACEAFAHAVQTGFTEHNITINFLKTKASIKLSAIPSLQPTSQVTWCGLRFCAETGSLTAHYSKLHGEQKIRDSITCASFATPRESLLKMMKAFLRPKCQPLLLDGRINAIGAVALNVFQLNVVAGAKLAALVKELTKRAQATSSRGAVAEVAANTIAIAKSVIESSVVHLLRLVHSRCRGGVGSLDTAALITQTAEGLGGSLEEYPGLSVHLGFCDEVRLHFRDDTVFTTVHSLRLPGELPPLQTTACPLYDNEIRFLAFAAYGRCFKECGNQLLDISRWCHRQCAHYATREDPIRPEVRAATDISFSTFFFKLDF